MLSFSVILLLFWYHFDEVLSFSAENTRHIFLVYERYFEEKVVEI